MDNKKEAIATRITIVLLVLILTAAAGVFAYTLKLHGCYKNSIQVTAKIDDIAIADYSPGQARGGSDDCILSTSVHRKGFGMKLSARASSLYVQTVPKDGRIIGRFSYCFQHGEGIVNPTCCLCHAALNLIPLFITVILLFIIYCSNSRYFAYNSSKYRLHLYLLMFCKSVPMQYIKNDEYQSR